MKTQFWTRKGYLGILMALVLAFSVQGIADAADLPLSKTSGDLQTMSVGDQFEITFRVGTRSNTTRIVNSDNKLVDDGVPDALTNATGRRIDTSGYPIREINGTDRRLGDDDALTNRVPPAPETPALPSDADPATVYTTAYAVYEQISSSQYRGPYSGNVYADTGRNAYSEAGYPLYYYIPAGQVYDIDNDGATDNSKTAPRKVGPRIKLRAENIVGSRLAANRYHYNQEEVTISVMKDAGAFENAGPSAPMTFKLKASGFQRNIVRPIAENPASDPNGLPSSVTLICTPVGDATTGTYKVRIEDTTPVADRPDATPLTDRAYIEFTLYVVDEAAVTIAAADDDIFYAGETLRIDNDFTVSTANANALIHYEVLSGPGTVFERTSATNTTTPAKSRLTSTSAQVYLILNNGNSVVRGSISGQDPVKRGVEITYTYTGSGAPTRDSDSDTRDPAPSTNTITISPSSSTGEPGGTVTVNVSSSPTGQLVTLSSNDFANTNFSPQSGITPFSSTLTLPSSTGSYTFFAVGSIGGATVSDSESITVETVALGTLTAVQENQLIRVTANPAPSSNLAFTLTRGGVPAGGGEILPAGWGRAIPTGLTTGSHILTVNATGYNATQVSFTAGATTTTTTDTTPDPTTPTTPTTTTPTVSEPSSLQIAGQSTRSGTANTALDAPLLVRVLDDDGDAVAETRVIFRVRTGQGRLSERGNGRAVAVQTDASGYARAPYTPISASSTVEAEASGVTRRVTFTITASGGAVTPTTRDTDTGSDTISPVVQTAAAKRPPMLWVDNGAIYALVDTDVQRFAPTVDNALSLAIGGDTVYWTEKTGDSAGTINSAHLDGTGIKELKAIMAVPMGITVDTTANLLYWTNSRGRIQSLNADGSGRVENVLQNLTSPLDIGLAGGNVYWTHSNGGIGFASLRGQKQVRNISNGADAAGSLVIGGGKVYWTEETGENGGRIKSANLNGSGITDVASIFAVPIGIGLDSSRGKLFWTNSRGRIQSSDLEGNGVSNVVDGLGSPGDMVLSNSIAAPAATTTTTTTADNAKYDVNNDGTVDNMDAGLVSEAMGTSNAKYDVNNDGTVNFLDLLLVFDNRDEGAASAPTVLGMQLSAVQVDVIEEQIDLLIATGDRSPAAMRTLIYLQQLIATARPEQTQLLANYPNPFNPETWIPYELATDTDVRLTIYNTHGVVIRTLQLGHQSAGYYVGRDRAAYWDGRNAFGEQVASGIYFYQLETDAMSLMRKMVILK